MELYIGEDCASISSPEFQNCEMVNKNGQAWKEDD